MKSISVPLQYLIAAALEVTDVNLFKPSGFTMGMNNWNIAQLRILAILRHCTKSSINETFRVFNITLTFR